MYRIKLKRTRGTARAATVKKRLLLLLLLALGGAWLAHAAQHGGAAYSVSLNSPTAFPVDI